MTPRPAPRCPPVAETALIVSCRNSSASCFSSASVSVRMSSGVRTRSSRGVEVSALIRSPGGFRGKTVEDQHVNAPLSAKGGAGNSCYGPTQIQPAYGEAVDHRGETGQAQAFVLLK